MIPCPTSNPACTTGRAGAGTTACPTSTPSCPASGPSGYPRQAWDAGWGDLGAPRNQSKAIDERDAQLIDHHLVWLTIVHRTTIKEHYIEHNGQRREQLDEACRALED